MLHLPLWLAAHERRKEERELHCQSLVSYLTPVGPHHTQVGQGATLLLGGARLREEEEEGDGGFGEGVRRRRRVGGHISFLDKSFLPAVR